MARRITKGPPITIRLPIEVHDAAVCFVSTLPEAPDKPADLRAWSERYIERAIRHHAMHDRSPSVPSSDGG